MLNLLSKNKIINQLTIVQKKKKKQLTPVKAGFKPIQCSAGFHASYDGVSI